MASRGNATTAQSAADSFDMSYSAQLQPSTRPAKDRGGVFFGNTAHYRKGDFHHNQGVRLASAYKGQLKTPPSQLGAGDPYNMPETPQPPGTAIPVGGYTAMGPHNSVFGKDAVQRAAQAAGGSGARGRNRGTSRMARFGGMSALPVTGSGPFANLQHGRARSQPLYPTEVQDEGTDLFRTPVTAPDFDTAVPRRQDLGVMSRDRQVGGDSGVYQALTSYDPSTANVLPRTGIEGQGANRGSRIGKQGMIERSKLNPKRMFADGIQGLGPTDAQFVGVMVDPYTGYEYDAYESEAAPPTGDYRVKD